MHFLITAGGTKEYIDPVRFISNASSGKMGYALAAAAASRRHRVTLISAVTNLKAEAKIEVVKVDSAADMFEEVKRYFSKSDCIIMAAAVSDYTPVKKSAFKIKKSAGNLVIKLKPTVDILKWAGTNSKRAGKIVVGFALEDKNARQNAQKKLSEKNLDMIVLNRPASIGSENTKIEIKTEFEKDWQSFGASSKKAAGTKIIGLIEEIADGKKYEK